MNVRYLEESRGVTDLSPLIALEYCSIAYSGSPRPPPLSVPFGRPRGELFARARAPSPSPFPLLTHEL